MPNQQLESISPVVFAEILGCQLTDYQADIARSVAESDRVSVASCHSAGKTFLGGILATWFLTAYDDSVVICLAPSERQITRALMPEIKKFGQKLVELGVWDADTAFNKTSVEIEDGDRWAVGFSPGNTYLSADRTQGIHRNRILLIFDEAGGIPPPIWQSLTTLTSSGSDVKVLMIGNPTTDDPANEFYLSFRRGRGERFKIPVWATPNFIANGVDSVDKLKRFKGRGKIVNSNLVPVHWAKNQLDRYGPDNPNFKSRVLAEFVAGGNPDALIPLERVESAINKPIPDIEYKTILSVDPARFGSDNAVIMRSRLAVDWDDKHCQVKFLVVDKITRIAKGDLMSLVGRIVAQSEGVDEIGVDGVGLGAGAVDRLREVVDIEVIDINVASNPRDDKIYFNLRAELYMTLARAFELGRVSIPDDEQLITELGSVNYGFESSGKIKIESKDNTKKRLGHSPDNLDAMTLTCHLNPPLMVGTLF